MFLHDGLNKTAEYSLSDTYFFDDKVTICKDVNKILEKHPDENIYLVNWDSASKNDLKYKYNVSQREVYNSGDVAVLKLMH